MSILSGNIIFEKLKTARILFMMNNFKELLKRCINCSCNKNRKCRGYLKLNSGKTDYEVCCEFFTGNKKKAKILKM